MRLRVDCLYLGRKYAWGVAIAQARTDRLTSTFGAEGSKHPGAPFSSPVKAGTTLEIGDPRELFEVRLPALSGEFVDVAPDGETFAVALRTEPSGSVPMTIVANWPATLPAR